MHPEKNCKFLAPCLLVLTFATLPDFCDQALCSRWYWYIPMYVFTNIIMTFSIMVICLVFHSWKLCGQHFRQLCDRNCIYHFVLFLLFFKPIVRYHWACAPIMTFSPSNISDTFFSNFNNETVQLFDVISISLLCFSALFY